jgi:hypothetical protein
MNLVDGCALTGEPARALINSAQREMRQIQTDIQKLRRPYVLTPRDDETGAGTDDDGALILQLPDSVHELDVATLLEPRELSDDDDAANASAAALAATLCVADLAAGSAVDDEAALEATLRLPMGAGGFAWEIDTGAAAGAAAPLQRAAAPRAPKRGGSAAAAASAARTPPPLPTVAWQPALRGVPTDASLRVKADKLREILAQHLGGQQQLDAVLARAREEVADLEAEAGVKLLLGLRADVLLPVVHTLVELEDCLEFAE